MMSTGQRHIRSTGCSCAQKGRPESAKQGQTMIQTYPVISQPDWGRYLVEQMAGWWSLPTKGKQKVKKEREREAAEQKENNSTLYTEMHRGAGRE